MLAEPFTSAYMLDRSEQLINCALRGIVCSQVKSPICLADAHCKSPLNLSCSMVLIGIKRPLKLDELTYAWASKMGDKDSLSNTGSKVHGFG